MAYKFYRTEGIHYYVLALKRQPVLRKWLVAMKRQSPPVAPGFRVCSDHFTEVDYIYKPVFNASGMLTKVKTNCLMPDAVPSVFNLQTSQLAETHFREVAY